MIIGRGVMDDVSVIGRDETDNHLQASPKAPITASVG
jgi:hypothetical protein